MMPEVAIALYFSRGDELLAQRVLHAQIEREFDRLLQAVGGETSQMQRGEPLPVDPLLDTGNALVVDIHMPDLVRDHSAIGIDALVLG
jgi:hypothetical protein